MKMSLENTFIAVMLCLMGFAVNHAYPTKEAWPEECKGKTYCHVQPDYYPKETFAKILDGVNLQFQQGGGVSNRSSEGDVASCSTIKRFDKIYLILDDSDTIRFVAQNEDVFSFMLQIEECSTPGRTYSSALDEDHLREQRVDCYETRQPFEFPVLSLDGAKLESMAPKGGVPVSCSAKVIAT
ncbi:uncharacterized protein LOC125242658 [Leguminivora glycinivorella]|uniref:uncharacterized protein LOC125242658 n=1 Tax=Leguminivora glycinivorella TaxID=1035111 RepID=UPI00200EF174|nr:uncharacterized protein LOC125242658 [Leguminivora glycinivorella]